MAEALGLTPTELFEKWHDGLTLSEIAEAQGVDIAAIQEAIRSARAAALLEEAKARIEAAVEAGTMTQEEADWLLEGIEKGYRHGVGLLQNRLGAGDQGQGPMGTPGDEGSLPGGRLGRGRWGAEQQFRAPGAESEGSSQPQTESGTQS